MSTITIKIKGTNQIAKASHGDKLLDVLLRNRIEIDHSCGGMGTCGTCRIWTDSTDLELQQRSEVEKEMASERGFSLKERLACQFEVVRSQEIEIP